jgi:hypothetical protein
VQQFSEQSCAGDEHLVRRDDYFLLTSRVHDFMSPC